MSHKHVFYTSAFLRKFNIFLFSSCRLLSAALFARSSLRLHDTTNTHVHSGTSRTGHLHKILSDQIPTPELRKPHYSRQRKRKGEGRRERGYEGEREGGREGEREGEEGREGGSGDTKGRGREGEREGGDANFFLFSAS